LIHLICAGILIPIFQKKEAQKINEEPKVPQIWRGGSGIRAHML
jgi:hypothetical protein